jgi:hypoxanthine-DNA glycosylase
MRGTSRRAARHQLHRDAGLAAAGDRVSGFPPLAAPGARVLVLGTMPGVASLRAGQYYAHPRNAFWPIVQALFDIDTGAGYAERCARLGARGVAVWDVLRACARPGSLDTAIVPGSAVANDFAGFFATQPALRAICFNGAAAEALFARHVVRAGHAPAGVARVRLPSTSPANARRRLADKIAAWRLVAHWCG